MEIDNVVNNLLPESFNYEIVSFKAAEGMGDFRFDLEFRVNAVSEVDVKSFLSQLNKSTCCTFNILSGRQDKRQYRAKAASSLRGYRKCAHNVVTPISRSRKKTH